MSALNKAMFATVLLAFMLWRSLPHTGFQALCAVIATACAAIFWAAAVKEFFPSSNGRK